MLPPTISTARTQPVDPQPLMLLYSIVPNEYRLKVPSVSGLNPEYVTLPAAKLAKVEWRTLVSTCAVAKTPRPWLVNVLYVTSTFAVDCGAWKTWTAVVFALEPWNCT